MQVDRFALLAVGEIDGNRPGHRAPADAEAVADGEADIVEVVDGIAGPVTMAMIKVKLDTIR